MSEETTKTNNIIMTAVIVALVVGIGFFAFKGAADTESDATIIVATVENDEVVEEVMVIADQGSAEDKSDTVPAVEMTEAATTADANEE